MIEPIFTKPEIHEKKWGRELWIHNSEKYCGKILEINKNWYFSMHFHLLKEETWYVLSGVLQMEFFDLNNAQKKQKILNCGDVIHLVPGVVHKLLAIEDSKIMEVSTQHFECDSYRVESSGYLE